MYEIDRIFKVIDYKNNTNKSDRWIGEHLGVSRTTVKRWFDKYALSLEKLIEKVYNNRIYEEIKQKKRLLIDKKIGNISIINYFKDIIKKNPFLQRKELAMLISTKFNINFNINKISLLIAKLRYTYKKPRQYIVKDKKFIDTLTKQRNKFIEDIKHKNLDKIISIDEAGFNKLENKRRGLSEKGKAISIPHETEYKNSSLLLVITTKKILHYSINEENTDGDIFNEFIQETAILKIEDF